MKKSLFSYFILMILLLLGGCTGTSSTPACGSCGTNLATVSMGGNNDSVVDQATNVSLAPLIVLNYSESMDSKTVNHDTVLLSTSQVTDTTQQGILAIGNIVASENNKTFTFSPESALLPNTKYYITVTKDNKTASGISVSGQFSFTTGNYTAPTVSMLTPSNNNQVGLNPIIQLKFSEAVQGVNSKTITLHEDSINGVVLVTSAIISGSDNTYTFSPTTSLNSKTSYYVVVADTITDLEGNHLVETNFHFVTSDFTKGDSSTPEVALINPSNNATGITTTPNIEIKFSEAVVGVDSNTITIHSGSIDGPLVPIGAFTPGADNTYIFSPQTALLSNTTYYITLTNGITDIAGNSLTITNFLFTTGDFTAPEVSILEPLDNATDVELSPTIKIRFSEAVQNITSSTVTLRRGSPDEDTVAISQITDEGNNTYSFTPATSLSPNINYYVVLNNQITDNSGNNLPPTNFHFTTINILGAAYIVSRDNNDVTLCDIYSDNSLNNCHTTATIYSPSSQVFLNPDKTAAYILAAGNSELNRCDINTDKSLSNCTGIGNVPTGSNVMTMNSAATRIYVSSVFSNSAAYTCPLVGDSLQGCNLATSENFNFPININLNNTGSIAYFSVFGSGKVQSCPIQGDGSFGACSDVASVSDPSSVAFNPAGDRAYIGRYSNTNLVMCQVSGDGSFNTCSDTGSGFNTPTSLAFGLGGGIAYVTDRGTNQVSKCDVAIDGTFSNCTYTATGIPQPFWITLNYY